MIFSLFLLREFNFFVLFCIFRYRAKEIDKYVHRD